MTSLLDVLVKIVEENVGVYRASPSRLQEDVSQEAQVAGDYRGRLVYELLQNADDAMAEGGTGDRVRFRVTDDELWVANTGRALNEADLRGLCGLGASSKIAAGSGRRASIGHKGLGFKSVLEICDAPEVYSRSVSFLLGAEHARPHIDHLRSEAGSRLSPTVPAMRFPHPDRGDHPVWLEFANDGFNTAFRLPFRSELSVERRAAIATALLDLPLTTVLFLKHLEAIDVEIAQSELAETASWSVDRQRKNADGWVTVDGLSASGSYRVTVANSLEEYGFLLAHDADVQIGTNRLGLSSPAWDGVELTEVSVATPLPDGPPMPEAWKHFHVFLPTAEPSESAVLVNGAFTTDLSRQQVRVSDEIGDYNSYLVAQAARLFADELMPVLAESGLGAVLKAIDRGAATGRPDTGTAAGLFHSALKNQLATRPLVPSPDGKRSPVGSTVVPPAYLRDGGVSYRQLLVPSARFEGRVFPVAEVCDGQMGRVLVDYGAIELDVRGSLEALAELQDPEAVRVSDHDSGGFEVDPILSMCERMWRACPPPERTALKDSARKLPLFPVRRNDDRSIERIALDGDAAFYPPRAARLELPMPGLRFMAHSLCWGALSQKERQGALGDQMAIWSGLFDINEFRFDAVARAAITPALTLERDRTSAELLEALKDLDTFAAICQLAGGNSKSDRPLRFQRLGTDRALFPLSRLPVPCRPTEPNGPVEWVPAFRVYLGTDWVGDRSVEALLSKLPGDVADELGFQFLLGPDDLLGRLDEPQTHTAATDTLADEDVGDDEDLDTSVEADEKSRWLSFLSWIGVNTGLRLIHFHDVDLKGPVWIHTGDLNRGRTGWMQRAEELWDDYTTHLREAIADQFGGARDEVPYLYEVHDLEGIASIAREAALDEKSEVAQALLDHLARNWEVYAARTEARLALIHRQMDPRRRTKPAKPSVEEARSVGTNFWLFRLQRLAICPTSHGPRRPDRSWFPTPELARRFSSEKRNAADLLPVVHDTVGHVGSSYTRLARALGVREEISPTTFGLDDARLLCERLDEIYGEAGYEQLDDAARKHVIRPAYRQLFELLSGQSIPENKDKLADVPLLAVANGQWRFLPGQDILFTRTPGLRERLGLREAVPTFVLEAAPATFTPLGRLFGSRAMEDVLQQAVAPGAVPFADADLEEFRTQLMGLATVLLARIHIERNDPSDETAVRSFLASVMPVDRVDVTYSVDGGEIAGPQSRSYYSTSSRGTGPDCPYVVWKSDEPWPPPPESAGNLAMALADATGLNLVEAFLAFFQSAPDQHHRLLAIAGATDLLDEVAVEPTPATATDQPSPIPPSSDDSGLTMSTPLAGAHDASGAAAPPVKLRVFEHLSIDGESIIVSGTPHDRSETEPQAPVGERSSTDVAPPHAATRSPKAAAGTDLSALDSLGMRITIASEVRRLRLLGYESAHLVIDQRTSEENLVVDVHSPANIQQAESSSELVRAKFAELEAQGISRVYPGCDIITIRDGEIERMIELKSSLTDARVQEMSWNEWKTAQSGVVRSRFWLYLVGNLRADVAHPPFVRAIHDPFGTLAAAEHKDTQTRRRVQLRVREFDEAEFLELGLLQPHPEEPED